MIMLVLELLVFSNPYLYRLTALAWQPLPINIAKEKKYSAGIVLGGMSGYDKNDSGHFGNNADRFIQTANLYNQGNLKKNNNQRRYRKIRTG